MAKDWDWTDNKFGPLPPDVAEKPKTKLRRFVLRRVEDVSGMSGTGYVAEGIEFSNGQVAMTWLSSHTSIAFHHNIKEVETIHGHEGRTTIVWID